MNQLSHVQFSTNFTRIQCTDGFGIGHGFDIPPISSYSARATSVYVVAVAASQSGVVLLACRSLLLQRLTNSSCSARCVQFYWKCTMSQEVLERYVAASSVVIVSGDVIFHCSGFRRTTPPQLFPSCEYITTSFSSFIHQRCNNIMNPNLKGQLDDEESIASTPQYCTAQQAIKHIVLLCTPSKPALPLLLIINV